MIPSKFNKLGINRVSEVEHKITIKFRVQDSTQSGTYINIDKIYIDNVEIEFSLLDYWYSIEVAENSVIRLMIEKSNYINYDQAINVNNLNNSTIQMTQVMEEGSRREVTSWSTGPKDLDTHFLVLDKSGNKVYEKYYQNKDSDYIEGDMVIHLDKDSTNYGSETITCTSLNYEKYNFVYIILDYNNRNNTSSVSMSNSDASVVVNSIDGSHTILPNKNTVGIIWEIYKIIDGHLVIINNITNDNNYGITK